MAKVRKTIRKIKDQFESTPIPLGINSDIGFEEKVITEGLITFLKNQIIIWKEVNYTEKEISDLIYGYFITIEKFNGNEFEYNRFKNEFIF